LVGAVGIEPSGLLQTRNLFILRSDESDKNARNGELRYKKGTKTAFVWRDALENEVAALVLKILVEYQVADIAGDPIKID